MRIANTLSEKQIPCDGIMLDAHYMNYYQLLFAWDKKVSPSLLALSMAEQARV